ncbi:hypothetical protein Gotri_000529, partial [Gossypium trilobum]|nr:hypothetical protein [Gossypium trilobum]
MVGRGGSVALGPLGNMVGSGGSAPGFGRLGKDGNGKDGNGGENKLAIEGIAVGILGTEGMLGRGGSVAFGPLGNMVGSGGSAPSFGNEG